MTEPNADDTLELGPEVPPDFVDRVESEKPPDAAPDDAQAPPPEDPQELAAALDGIESAELLEAAFTATHEALAPAWPIKAHQHRAMASAWGKVVDRYLGPLVSEHGELVVAIYVTALAIGPHVAKPRFEPDAGADAET